MHLQPPVTISLRHPPSGGGLPAWLRPWEGSLEGVKWALGGGVWAVEHKVLRADRALQKVLREAEGAGLATLQVILTFGCQIGCRLVVNLVAKLVAKLVAIWLP
jgi:hypothetical protein